MMGRSRILARILAPCLALAALGAGGVVWAQRAASYSNVDETRIALARALAEEKAARQRATVLEQRAARTTEAAERTAREAAALAARIQHSEVEIAAGEARLALIDRQRGILRTRLASKQKPVVRLTAALQNLSRRPLALSVLQPGSLKDTVHLRAVLASTVPQVEQRTADLRGEIARSRALEQQARAVLDGLKASEGQWAERRQQLAVLEARQRLASREASGVAARESDRALALAEDAQDLDGLVDRLEQASAIRKKLAALPGPIIRPARPAESRVIADMEPPPAFADAAPADYQLPVIGRIVSGFGAVSQAGLRNEGISLAPRALAQVVAPAGGRVAFAGAYRGYNRIVIIEHDGGWTSLVTGLARVDVRVGETLVPGTPLGVAGPGRPVVTLELRHGTVPVNPLEYLG
jgi:septal ring factor EnvC (AmiA/AmiB activator)